MKTIDEIKAILSPKEEENFEEIAKDLLVQMYGEDKLVTFHRIFVGKIGDPSLFFDGLAVHKNRLICHSQAEYGGDGVADCLGTPENGKIPPITNDMLKEACKLLLDKDNIHVEFNFNTMKEEHEYQTHMRHCTKTHKEDFVKLLTGDVNCIQCFY
jgi:hypothetical protein